MVQATFDSDCNLVGLKTLEKNGNKSSVMKLRSHIPSSRIPTHSCNRKDKHNKQHFIFEG